MLPYWLKRRSANPTCSSEVPLLSAVPPDPASESRWSSRDKPSVRCWPGPLLEPAPAVAQPPVPQPYVAAVPSHRLSFPRGSTLRVARLPHCCSRRPWPRCRPSSSSGVCSPQIQLPPRRLKIARCPEMAGSASAYDPPAQKPLDRTQLRLIYDP